MVDQKITIVINIGTEIIVVMVITHTENLLVVVALDTKKILGTIMKIMVKMIKKIFIRIMNKVFEGEKMVVMIAPKVGEEVMVKMSQGIKIPTVNRLLDIEMTGILERTIVEIQISSGMVVMKVVEAADQGRISAEDTKKLETGMVIILIINTGRRTGTIIIIV